MGANERMWNKVFREHTTVNPSCPGNLQWDEKAERQQGLCWIESAYCTECSYKSGSFKLFDEINDGKPGIKAAKPNMGIHAALSQTPVGYDSLRKVLLAANSPAPSSTGLFKSASKANKSFVDENKQDMQCRRLQLKEINQIRGRDPASISVEGDGAYNNPVYSGIGKTPFQAATQATYIMAEAETTKRQIVAITTSNKLCRKAGPLEICPSTPHDCTANIAQNVSIGNEQKMATGCLEEIASDGFHITSLTTDPDSGACKAAEELHHKNILKFKPEHYLDTRHLSENQRKTVNKINFSKNMLPGKTQDIKNKLKKRFAHDLVKRCEAEFKAAQSMHAGNLRLLKKSLSYAKYAVVKCYQNDHSECKRHSFACNGGKIKNWLNSSHFNLSKNFKLNCTEDDEYKLHQCVEYRLGPKTIEKTRLGMNTQKVEAVNRTIRRSLPKNVTYTRNFEGRAHVAIHSNNNGPGLSVYKLCKKVGAPVSDGTRVTRSLLALQKSREQQLKYHRSDTAKTKRSKKTHALYKMYDEAQFAKQQDYKKAGLCPKVKLSPRKCRSKTDHNYSKN